MVHNNITNQMNFAFPKIAFNMKLCVQTLSARRVLKYIRYKYFYTTVNGIELFYTFIFVMSINL